MGQSIQEWIKLNLRKTVFKKFEVIWSAKAVLVTDVFKSHLNLSKYFNRHIFFYIDL